MEPKAMIVIPAGTMYWWNRTGEQMEELYRKDREMGDTLDSAGEPRVYCRTASNRLTHPTLFALVSRRNLPWHGWHRKPTHLMLGIATIDGIPREVMVKDPAKKGSLYA